MYSIKVTDIQKRYYLFNNPLEVLLSRIFPNKKVKEFFALKGVSFEAGIGETIGIVGHNGSGKSTLLQIITGVLQASKGDVEVNGRVAALLELGSGFNPEFTGLENVYFNASIIGLKRHEIDERLEKILAFADIGEFIDRPVKTYSSGMMVRLAFSVLINIDPDILIVDEALAVGDDAFQRKCFARLKELQAQGVTIILVSHSAGQVISLCDRAILLDHGDVLLEGDPREVIKHYHKLLNMEGLKRESYRNELQLHGFNATAASSTDEIDTQQQKVKTVNTPSESALWYDKNGAEISDPRIVDEEGEPVDVLKSAHRYQFQYRVKFSDDCFDVFLGMMIRNVAGFELGGATSAHDKSLIIQSAKRDDVIDVTIEFTCNLRNGTYFLNCGCFGTKDGKPTFLNRGVDILSFKVVEQNNISTGTVDFFPKYTVEKGILTP